MGLTLDYSAGQTPLDEDEKDGLLLPHITTRGELDEFEQLNIQQAVLWSVSGRIVVDSVLTEEFILELHRRMLGDVWSWAGSFRRTNKNIGVDKYEIPIALRNLLDDCRYWIEHNTYSDDEIAIRLKHRIVSIHCFANGNGRHSRLLADVLCVRVFRRPEFTWGATNLSSSGDVRRRYLDALHLADDGNIQPLIEFARS